MFYIVRASPSPEDHWNPVAAVNQILPLATSLCPFVAKMRTKYLSLPLFIAALAGHRCGT